MKEHFSRNDSTPVSRTSSPAAEPSVSGAGDGISMGYVPALDGLRALAVIAVILYHADLGWLPGGFIGVEVFFVISGFLITSLLLEEAEREGGIALRQFWLRRARRLLPAVYVMLVLVSAWALLFSDLMVGQLRHDFLPAVFYVSNWWQIFFSDVPYFAPVDPPLLRHLWSLAVEEQWYLLWPFAFVALMRWKRNRAQAAQTLLIIAVVIMLLTAVLYNGNADRTNFLYLSTLTRSTGLLLGAAGAMLWRPWLASVRSRRNTPTVADMPERVLSIAAFASGALLLLLAVVLRVEGAVLYRGGLALVSVSSLVLVAATVHPNAVGLRRIMGSRPLVEIGKRSYGLYLWHWPIFLFSDARESAGKFAVACVITAVVTEASYRLVEMPVRHGLIGRSMVALRNRDNRDLRIAATGYGVAAIVLTASVGIALSATKPIDISMDQGADVEFGATTVPLADPSQTTIPGVVSPTTTIPVLADPVNLVIVGDSQAKSLAINQPAGIEKTFTVTDGAVSGCGVYDAGTAISPGIEFRQNLDFCKGWEEKWTKAVEKAQGDVALVALGAWEVLDVLHAGVNYSFFSPQADQLFKTQVKKGVDALVAGGAKVALLEVPCMRPKDVEGAGIPPLPERGDDNRTRHLNELLKQVAAENADTTAFVNGPREWCTSEIIANDLGYRWDGVHVYKPGAKLIMDTIAGSLLAL
jgi:peptidoglycan/LPS O-acetylase OafA/YrhL